MRKLQQTVRVPSAAGSDLHSTLRRFYVRRNAIATT